MAAPPLARAAASESSDEELRFGNEELRLRDDEELQLAGNYEDAQLERNDDDKRCSASPSDAYDATHTRLASSCRADGGGCRCVRMGRG